ncbi:hypothetical protein [Roseivirga misakiensis]|uniref:Uncharacterized protein n=1 Tax=Roseivirga misakiensis TaxID=1563681 RepID=A0A1E5SY58_9BACT|nr:hypothetical protein [Roseivirga misakiensis]OEK04059.1 hypothetical protein BFP71_11240 [Roseivirga misakiensis]
MRIFIVSLLFVSCFHLSIAQREQFEFPSQVWHEGSVTLVDGTKLDGNVKYDLSADLIQVIVDQKTLTYGANQIRQFDIFQKDIALKRLFFSIPFTTETGYRRPKLFEVLVDARTSLIAREFIALSTRTIDNPYYRWGARRFNPIGGRSVQVRYLDYKFYLVDSSNGKMELLGSSKKEVISAFRNKQNEIRRYIKDKKLKVDQVEDIIEIVRYYNQIQGT